MNSVRDLNRTWNWRIAPGVCTRPAEEERRLGLRMEWDRGMCGKGYRVTRRCSDGVDELRREWMNEGWNK